MNHGFIEGKQLFTDSTFLKADASKNRFKKQKITVPSRAIWTNLKKQLLE
jgi:hypothetical protein